MWHRLLIILLLLLGIPAQGAYVSFVWDPNQELDLAGYRLHRGTSSRQYTESIDVGNRTAYTWTVPDVTQFFALTAHNLGGYSSDFSNEVTWSPQAQPIQPATGVRVEWSEVSQSMATDNFNRADENPLSGGGNWQSPPSGFYSFKIVSNAVRTTISTQYCLQSYIGSYTDNQYSKCTSSVSKSVGPAIRINEANGYYLAPGVQTGQYRIRLMKIVSGSVSMLTEFLVAYQDTYLLCIEINNNIITIICEGSTLGTYDDSASPLGSGAIGLAGKASTLSTSADDWEGGDLGGAPAERVPSMIMHPKMFFVPRRYREV